MPIRRPRRVPAARHLPAVAAGIAVVTAVALAPTVVHQVRSGSSPAAHPGRPAHRDVQANLFEWNWPSVARECTTVLGPAGYGGVQVSPPADSLQRQHLGDGSDTVLHPWWEVYQPVDYTLTSRMGTPAQFRSMVATCRRAGVRVYVDAVINHMTGQGDTSYGGKHYSKYAYAGLYSAADFHNYPADCPVAPGAGTGAQNGTIADFNDYRQVHNCELVGLSDLRTESPAVRARLAGYLNSLIDMGVSGFRVDAAKHIDQTDLAAIFSRLHRTRDGARPEISLEVGAGSPGRISPEAYTSQGKVIGFDYATQIFNAFKSYNAPANDGNIGDLKVFGTGSGLPPSRDEVVFIQNHDTERGGSTLNYKDASNTIATAFMLAWGYGTPQVYSGFAFDTADQSPPATADGRITDTDCSDGTWVCLDRTVAGMVGFHNRVGAAPVRNWYDDGDNLIAFSRGDDGFFSANNEAAAKRITVSTGLRGGVYCDVVHGMRHGNRCSGPTVHVDRNGRATATVGAHDALAFTASDRVG